MSFSYWNFNIWVRISICLAINLILVTFVYVIPNVLALLPNVFDWMRTADYEIDFGSIIWNCSYISDFNLKALTVWGRIHGTSARWLVWGAWLRQRCFLGIFDSVTLVYDGRNEQWSRSIFQHTCWSQHACDKIAYFSLFNIRGISS